MIKSTAPGLFNAANGTFSTAGSRTAALKLGSSLLAIGGLLMSANAYAQDSAEPDSTQDPAAEPENLIVVTGIRAALESAQTIKRDADTVVDAITAEDIGALADRSVTEALQRVPGVAINRFAGSNDPDHFSVEGSGVTIRGLNYVRSEFNGRTAFSAGVGGQALNFADVPPELLGSVIINKNSTADMIEGGISGTVNLVTRKPLDGAGGFNLAFSAEANYGDFAKDWTPTVSGLISNTWDTDLGTFGILASGTFSQIKSRADGIQVTNYQARDNTEVLLANAGGALVCRNPLPSRSGADNNTLPAGGSPCGTFGTAGADGFADYDDLLFAPLGAQFRTQEFNRKRDGFAVSAQFESIDERTVITAEFIRSHTTNAWGEYTFETGPDLSEYTTQPFGCEQNDAGPGGSPRAQCANGAFQNFQYDDTGLFQSGYITNPSNGWRGDPGAGAAFTPIGGLQQVLARRQVDESTTNEDWSLNLESQLTDRLSIELDAQYATSRKENLDFSIFGSTFADQELDLTGDLPVGTPRKPNFLSYVWAGDNPELAALSDADYFVDPRVQFWRAAMDHIEDSEGDQYAFSGDVGYEFGDDSFIRKVKVGARFSDRETQVRYTTYNWGVLSEVWGANGDVVRFGQTDESQYEVYDFPDFFRGDTQAPPAALYYSGDLIDGYDEAGIFFKSINQLTQDRGGPAGWVPLAERGNAIAGTPFIPSDIQIIKERDFAAYGMLSFGSDTLFGDMRMAGNIGVRYVNLETRSVGNIAAPSAQQLNISDPFDVRCTAQGQNGPEPSTEPICLQGEAAYLALQQFTGASGDPVRSVRGSSTDLFLPSFNVKLEVAPDVIVRFAASKVLTRPDNALQRNFLNISLTEGGNLVAEGGNPELKPATAWTYDLTAEWYFAPVGSLTLNGFYKDISDFFFQDIVTQQVTGNGITQDVLVRGPANFDQGGKIKGFEVAYQQTYDFLPAPFDGLGIQANYTYIDSSGLPNTFLNGPDLANTSTVAPSGNLPLEQLSKHNVNATVFYEKGPISMRAAYNWRSRFLLTASDVIFPFYSIFNEDTGQLDASIFFNLTDQVKVGVQGVNLLNETTETLQAYQGDAENLAPRSFFTNDRRFSFIIRGNF